MTSCKPVSFSRRTLHHGVSKYQRHCYGGNKRRKMWLYHCKTALLVPLVHALNTGIQILIERDCLYLRNLQKEKCLKRSTDLNTMKNSITLAGETQIGPRNFPAPLWICLKKITFVPSGIFRKTLVRRPVDSNLCRSAETCEKWGLGQKLTQLAFFFILSE